MTHHECTSDLSQLRQFLNEPDVWKCNCGGEVSMWDVVEMLRARAAAQDAVLRLPEPLSGSVIGHAPAEHVYFAPLTPKKLREQGGL